VTADHRTDRRAPVANLVSGTVRAGELPGKVWRVRLVPYPPRPQADVDTSGCTAPSLVGAAGAEKACRGEP
jgi:hypothetical protein